MTKKYKILYKLFTLISILITLSPIIVYTVLAFINGEPSEKFCMGISCTVAFILVGANILFKHAYRSTIWVLILAIYYCLDNITGLLLFVAIGTILDEFIISPMAKSFKSKYIINKEIDKRG